MTLDMAPVIARAEAWLAKYPPNTGYTLAVLNYMKLKLERGEYPEGYNLVTQFMVQYTGIEEWGDVTSWDHREFHLPYSQTSRYSPDKSMDCSSFPYFVFKVWFNKNIGSWTEAQYDRIPKIGGHDVKYLGMGSWRPLDLIQYNFKSGRRVSHDSTYCGGGRIIHTRSSIHPLQRESADYQKDKIVKVWRILTDEEYESTFIGASNTTPPDPDPEAPVYTRPLKWGGVPGVYMRGADVLWAQQRLNKKMAGIIFVDRYLDWYKPPIEADGIYGKITEGCVYNYQTRNPDCGQPSGIIGPLTWASLAK